MVAYRRKRKTTENTQSEHKSESSQSQSLQISSEAESSQLLSKKVLSTKKIFAGRNIDFDFLAEEGFTFGQKSKTLDWDYLCSLDKPTYPDIVKEFYMNLGSGDSGLFVIVKNTLIQVNPNTLHEELKFPLVADFDIVPSRRECLTIIMKNKHLDFERDYHVRDFTPQIWLLHHIVNKIFFLKVDRFYFVGQ